jgi:hypothetical protein
MLKRFASPELDDGFAPSCGVARDSVAPAAGARPTAPRAQQTAAVLAAALGLASMAAAVAKQAVSSIATAPADETAAWALMLVGLAMVGVAAGRHISTEFIAAARRSAQSTPTRG